MLLLLVARLNVYDAVLYRYSSLKQSKTAGPPLTNMA